MRKIRTTRELRNLYKKEKREGETRVQWFARSLYLAPESVVNLFLFSESAQCRKAYHERKYNENKKYQREYYEKNKEERKAYQREYYHKKKLEMEEGGSIVFKKQGRPQKYKTEEARLAARKLQWKEWYEKNKKKKGGA